MTRRLGLGVISLNASMPKLSLSSSNTPTQLLHRNFLISKDLSSSYSLKFVKDLPAFSGWVFLCSQLVNNPDFSCSLRNRLEDGIDLRIPSKLSRKEISEQLAVSMCCQVEILSKMDQTAMVPKKKKKSKYIHLSRNSRNTYRTMKRFPSFDPEHNLIAITAPTRVRWVQNTAGKLKWHGKHVGRMNFLGYPVVGTIRMYGYDQIVIMKCKKEYR